MFYFFLPIETGYITFPEFVTIMAQKRETAEQHIRDTLQVLDEDGSGIIQLKELENNLATIGDTLKPHEISEILDEFDVDEKGNIDYDGTYKNIESITFTCLLGQVNFTNSIFAYLL